MFSVKYKQITSPHFIDAMQFLTTQRLPTKVAYNIKRLVDKIEMAKKAIAKEYHKDIIEVFALKDPDGKFIHPKDPEGNEMKDSFEPDATRKEDMEKCVDDFGNRCVTIDREKVMIDDFGKMELTVSHLAALEPILTSHEELAEFVTNAQSVG